MCRKADRETRVIASWAEQLRRKRSVVVPVLHAWMVEAFTFAMARRRSLIRQNHSAAGEIQFGVWVRGWPVPTPWRGSLALSVPFT